jgi:hypothetical protein
MTPEEREATERRLIEINRRLGIMSPPETCDEVVPELDAEELRALRRSHLGRRDRSSQWPPLRLGICLVER